MYPRMKKFMATVLFIVVASCGIGSSVASAEIKFGILPRLTTLDMYTMFKPLRNISPGKQAKR
jgi:hypothetical protein